VTAIDDFKQFVADAQSGSQYAKWAHDNPSDLGRWQTFRDAILAGQSPAAPTMTTDHGRELVDAAVETEHYRALEAPPLPPPPPPPIPSSSLPLQGVSAPLGNITGKSDADQDWFLDRLVELGNGHRVFLRTDWWPGSGLRRLLTLNRRRFRAHRLGATFGTLATKIAARKLADGSPAIIVLPLLNYDNASKPTQATFATYAGQIAQLGHPVINILNEPDMSGWDPVVAADYFNAARNAIRAVNPNAIVIGPSTWKTGSQKPADGFAWDQKFIVELHAKGSRTDWFDKHLYALVSGDRTWNNWAWIGDLRARLNANGMADVPICATEMGERPSTDGDQSQVDAVSTGFDARTPGYVSPFGSYALPAPVSPTLVYSIFNDAPPGGFGLYRDDRTARPAVATFKSKAR
jgi:hypothetical protein